MQENQQSPRQRTTDESDSSAANGGVNGGGHGHSAATKHTLESLAGNYKLTPATLYNRIDPLWIPKDFLLRASMKIAQTIIKPNGRLIISWPPRHGKSRLATIATPIWILENYPQLNIILSTYGADLSTDFGREVRDLFRSNESILNERIRSDVQNVGRFMTTKGGGMLSVGLGGAITGKGADVFLIDDYIKTMEEALSPTKRDRDWEWFTGTAYHRLEPNASMIIIATRWHKQDLIGRILRHFPDEWEHIKFTAIAEEDDILGRKPGEALFPERYDIHQLEDRKKVLGTLFFNGIFQQEPVDDESKFTDRDWIEVVDYAPNMADLEFARIWDFGGGKRKEGDPTVGTLIAVNKHTHQCWILDIWRKRATPESVEIAVAEKAFTDGPDTKIIMEREPGASGIQLIAHYANNILPDYTVIESPSTTSKPTRAQPMVAAAEAGKVKVLKRSWTEDFLNEFDDFPDGDHDDQVDTVAIGYNTLLDRKPQSPVWGRKTPTLDKYDPEDEASIKGATRIRGAIWGRPKGTGRQASGRMW